MKYWENEKIEKEGKKTEEKLRIQRQEITDIQ
jgi:hypothetical protein